MKKVVLFFMAFCAVIVSCQKTVKVATTYSVETIQNTPLGDIYIPDNGSYTHSVLVKYLGGFHEDKVTLSISGLPADIHVVQDTFSKVPTYGANFVFTTTNATHATYPVTITATCEGTLPQIYNFNLTVVSADCASVLWGNFDGVNSCTARNFNYVATGTATGTTNELDIVNLGGYGSATIARALINCNRDSLTIPQQHIGNGTNLSGYGVIAGNTITIYYSATTTPGGFPEDCIATLTKQ